MYTCLLYVNQYAYYKYDYNYIVVFNTHIDILDIDTYIIKMYEYLNISFSTRPYIVYVNI